MNVSGKEAFHRLAFQAGGFLVFCLAHVCAGDVDIITVRTEGRAAGVGLAARNAAIDEARREAVISVLHSLAPGIDHLPLDPIVRKAHGYVRNFEILRHDQMDGVTRVEIDAHVLEKPLRQDLAATMLPRLPTMPRVLIVIDERIEAGNEPEALFRGNIVASVLKEALGRQRIDVCDITHPGLPATPEQLAALPAATLETCSRMAQAIAMDVLIVGEAACAPESAPTGADVVRNRAVITLRVFRGIDGKMTDDLSAVASVYSLNPREGGEQALEDAAAKLAADTTVAVVIAALGAREDDRLLLTIIHPGSQERFDALLATLRDIPETQEAVVLFYSEDVARIRLRYDGAMSELIRAITARSYDGAELHVKKAVLREIHLEFPPSE